MNSEISASAALFFWLMLEWKMEGKPTLVGACVGAIAGLATITPCAAFVKPWAALTIGTLCVPWCYACIELTKKYNLDDALDVWAVHGMGGFFGTLCVGIFSSAAMTQGNTSKLAVSSSASSCSPPSAAPRTPSSSATPSSRFSKSSWMSSPAKATAGSAWTSPCTARRRTAKTRAAPRRAAPSTSNDITHLNNRRRTVVAVNINNVNNALLRSSEAMLRLNMRLRILYYLVAVRDDHGAPSRRGLERRRR